MNEKQEPKYMAVKGALVNRATGIAIPEDEPVFILRAKDRQAIEALQWYQSHCENYEHRKAIQARIEDFAQFRATHRELMKEPDTEPL